MWTASKIKKRSFKISHTLSLFDEQNHLTIWDYNSMSIQKKYMFFAATFAALAQMPLLDNFCLAAEAKTAAEKVTYEDHVKPILRAKCFSCHSTDTKKGGLDLSNYTALMQGGGSGESIESGSPDDSYLFMVMNHDVEPAMPPNSDKLPPEMLAVVSKWIENGALENSGSKAMKPKKPKTNFALQGAPTGRPEGPPPMPGRLGMQPTLHTAKTTAVTAMATSPWAPLVAIGGQQQVLLYDTKTSELLGVLPFPEGIPYCVKFSSSGQLLLAGGGKGGATGRVVVWSVATGERVFEVGDELDAVLAADISADQTLVALGGPKRTVRIYSTQTGELIQEIKKHTDWIQSISFSPDGVLLATGDRNGGLFVWESYTARQYLELRGHSASISGLSWRADSNILASCSEDSRIRLWEMENGGNIKNWGAHGGGVSDVEFSRDGRIVSCGRDRTCKLWDQNGKALVTYPAFSDLALKTSFCDEAGKVIAGDWNGTVRVWNAADAKHLGDLTTNPQPLEARLAAAQQLLKTSQAEQVKLAAVYKASQEAVAKLQANLAAAQKVATDSQNVVNSTAAVIKKSQEAIKTLTTTKQTLEAEIAALQKVMPPLTESTKKSQEAAAAAAEDKELAALATQSKAQLDKKTAEIAAKQKALADTVKTLETTNQQLATADKQNKESATALANANKQVATYTPQLKTAQEKAAADQKADQAANAKLVAAQKQVARWTDEIQFMQKLAVYQGHRKQLDSVTEQFQSVELEFNSVQTKLNAANTAVANAQTNQTNMIAAQATAAQNLKQAEAEQTGVQNLVNQLTAAAPLLKELQAKSAEIAQKVPGDKDLAATAAQNKAMAEKKAGELTAQQAALKQKQDLVAQRKNELAAADTKVAEAKAALEAAQKQAVAMANELKPVQEKLTGAQAAVDAAKKQVDTAKAALNTPRPS